MLSKESLTQGSKNTLKRELKKYLSDRRTVRRNPEEKKHRVKDDCQKFFRQRKRRRVMNASNVEHHVAHDEIDAFARVMQDCQQNASWTFFAPTAFGCCRFLSQLLTFKNSIGLRRWNTLPVAEDLTWHQCGMTSRYL